MRSLARHRARTICSMLVEMQEGGKFLAQGSYGCIFTDFMACKKGKLTADGDPLTKLTLQDDAEQEYGISEMIRKLPHWKQYFAVAEGICEPAKKQTEPDLDKCIPIKGHSFSDLRLLSTSYQGETMSRHKFATADMDIMRFATHFIEAGALLALFGIVHRDLHGGNFLIDAHHVPRIIDFNLALQVRPKMKEDDILHGIAVNITQEPPDSTIINAVVQGEDAEEIIAALIKKPIIKKIGRVLSIQQNISRDLRRFYYESRSAQAHDIVGWFHSYWRTVDSWAIGVNLVESFSLFSLWPSLAAKLDAVRGKLFPVVAQMCAINPMDRIDCVQALQLLDPNNFIVRTYGRAWLAKI